MIASAIKILAALFSSFALLWAGIGLAEWWEHRPAGVPTVHLRALFIPVTWRAPDSLAAERDKARADLVRSLTNEKSLTDAIQMQNDTLLSLAHAKAAEDAALAAARKAAVPARAKAQATVAQIASTPDGGSCPAAEALIRQEVG